jgi:hypothetical protein
MTTWTRNPSPQPGDFGYRRDDGLLATPFVDGTGRVVRVDVSRRDRVPTRDEVNGALIEFFPSGTSVRLVFPSQPGGNSQDNKVVARVERVVGDILSEHFQWDEFTRSETAERLGIDNVPGPQEREATQALVANVLEPVRVTWGPVKILSGYRSLALNRVVPGSSSTSQHVLGEAADITVPGIPNRVLFAWMRSQVPYDQLILEFPDDSNPFAGWVHASFREGRLRREALESFKTSSGGTAYRPVA